MSGDCRCSVHRITPMHAAARPPARASSRRGFTVLELMAAILIVGILAGLALPAFMDSIRKSRRADAFAAIAAAQQQQERWRANRAGYASALLDSAGPGEPPNGLGLPAASAAGYYDLSLSAVSASAYTIVASAIVASAAAAGSQAGDGVCRVLAVRMASGRVSHGSGVSADGLDWSDRGRCWAR